ncbi:class I SAM-dependent methyltransferase [Marimonas lutisalis]|uniref:class I SAM-dependent methyltransferase n=1 Tax=Marimonas lutisalis TaxID=2545756 RepID=UPI0010F600A4|nr:class I SAM-dependent methyltransferase [Marimonas lutisalis]
MSNAEFWNGMAERYARRPVQDEETYAHTLSRVRAHLGPRDHVLEVGAGTGTTALKLADAAERILATDYSQAMMQIARRKVADQGIGNVEFAVSPADLPPEGAFDAVMSFNMLHLVADPAATVAALAARLRPGGLFISKTPCLAGAEAGWKVRALLMLLPVLQWIGKAPLVSRFDVATLEAAFEGAGLEIIEAGNHSDAPPSRFIVARRPA